MKHSCNLIIFLLFNAINLQSNPIEDILNITNKDDLISYKKKYIEPTATHISATEATILLQLKDAYLAAKKGDINQAYQMLNTAKVNIETAQHISTPPALQSTATQLAIQLTKAAEEKILEHTTKAELKEKNKKKRIKHRSKKTAPTKTPKPEKQATEQEVTVIIPAKKVTPQEPPAAKKKLTKPTPPEKHIQQEQPQQKNENPKDEPEKLDQKIKTEQEEKAKKLAADKKNQAQQKKEQAAQQQARTMRDQEQERLKILETELENFNLEQDAAPMLLLNRLQKRKEDYLFQYLIQKTILLLLQENLIQETTQTQKDLLQAGQEVESFENEMVRPLKNYIEEIKTLSKIYKKDF